MVRKPKTPRPGGGESSDPQEAAGGSSGGTPRQPERGAPPQQGAGGAGYQGGRGYAPQTQQGCGRGGGGPPQASSRQPERGAPPQQGAGGAGYQGGRGYAPQTHQGCGRGGGGPPQASSRQPERGAPPQQGAGGDAPQTQQGRGRGGGGPPQSSSSSRTPVAPQNVPPLPPMGQSTAAETKVSYMEAMQASSSSRTPVAPQNVPPPMGQSTAAVTQFSYSQVPLRPLKGGSAGENCIVKANHFLAELLPDKDLHQYHVTITPEVRSRGLNRAVMERLVALYKASHLDNRLPAYDGGNNLYTAGPLPFPLEKFNITLDEEDGSVGQRPLLRKREFCVEIKLAAAAPLSPQEALKAFNIVLREAPTRKSYIHVGQSFCSRGFGEKPLGEGLESWLGFYQSIRRTQMGLSLNIDASSAAFITPLPVIDFVTQLLGRYNSASPLSGADCAKIEKALRGVKVEVTHQKRKYRVLGLTPDVTQNLTFTDNITGTLKSVVDYFYETYNLEIKHTHWPCLEVGNRQRPTYLPMQLCKIVEGQRYSKGLNQRQITALLEVNSRPPKLREHDILQTVCHNEYHKDPYADEFGIKISNELASVEARILPPPRLKYHDTGREKDCLPQVGQWSMTHKKMVNGGRVKNWICINFSRSVEDGQAHAFCIKLAQTCRISGMEFALEPLLPPLRSDPNEVERALKGAMTKLPPQGKKLDLLIVILPDNNGSLYGDLKRICETELGIVSQCCLTKHVLQKRETMRKLYLTSVSLKINVKVGGRNTVLVDALSKDLPVVGAEPTIIFGADVTHPEEDSGPSIAAVVASQDWPEMTKYTGLVCAQAHGQELIQDLYSMVRELLISFYKANRLLPPQRIIFYRDGVGEGQFYQILQKEVHAIQKACASLPNYKPKVTVVVVQKRHHTRLFANNHCDPKTVDSSGNILPGTVVDSKICHPTGFDFYLCSHAGIRGTSRPAHYHVLYDMNQFTADGLQLLTNYLCYTYARCTRSVSIVPPVYYAHLLAYRARFYVKSGGDAGLSAVRPLPALKDNVKGVMFYC